MEKSIWWRYDPYKQGCLKDGILMRWWIEQQLLKDKAFRRYAAGVDKALSLFETALEEWADYISFLNRLLRV